MADTGRSEGTQAETDRKDRETGSPADGRSDSVADRGADEDLATYDRGQVAGPDLPDADSGAVIGGVADEELRPNE